MNLIMKQKSPNSKTGFLHLIGSGRGYVRLAKLEPYLLILPAFTILMLFFLWPALFNIILSFQKISLFELAKGGKWIGVGNFYELLVKDPLTRLSLTNTVVYLTVATVAMRLLIGMGLALLLNADVLRRWRLAGLARSLALIPWVVPPVVAVAAWKWLLHPSFGAVNIFLINLGLINDGIPFMVRTSTVWWAIIAIIVWRELPLVTISFLAGLQAIPQDLYEAAKVDGASGLALFWHITLPLLAPIITVITLLTVIWTYNNFVYVWLSTAGGPGNYTQVLATQMYTEAFTKYRLGYGASVGVLMSIIMLVFSIIYFTTVFRKNIGKQGI